jgi:hypothetical protein
VQGLVFVARPLYVYALSAAQTKYPIASIGRLIMTNEWEMTQKETLVV